jgi:hypothetical protein
MMVRTAVITACAVAALGALAPVGSAAAAGGGGPSITRGSDHATFPDDFILDLCGISADVTLTERWTLKEFPDGSETLHTVRTFVSSDPRIPLEKGAATSFTAPDGSRVVVGKPIQLFRPGGGVLVLDAGRIAFDADGNVTDSRGQHTFFDSDPAGYYCP